MINCNEKYINDINDYIMTKRIEVNIDIRLNDMDNLIKILNWDGKDNLNKRTKRNILNWINVSKYKDKVYNSIEKLKLHNIKKLVDGYE